ncbi:MAG: hypothetical protein L0H79_02195 [Intrasporangium sp.]|uniref:hypothetical protein n=1 Tax=Intrasporangium sp. TaxID=1925024 RepID=UPI002649E9A0|nr:hypothetical protein [Intrasporangium sp.]MDN5794545.1 hypothetical protein [Intrasporangium sp.]
MTRRPWLPSSRSSGGSTACPWPSRRATLPRHQTLRAVVDWSWELLSPQERLLAERLDVFPSGASAPAAQTICVGDGLDALAAADGLDALAEK